AGSPASPGPRGSWSFPIRKGPSRRAIPSATCRSRLSASERGPRQSAGPDLEHPGREPARPGPARAGEDVDVGRTPDPRHLAGAGILPEGPALAGIDLLGVTGDGAQPEFVALDKPELIVAVE